MYTPRKRLAASLGLAVAISGLAALPASANTAGTGLVISEVYGGGGSAAAVYNADFVELYNPTDSAIPLTGMSIHYRSAKGTSGGTPFALSGSVPPKKTWLIQMSAASEAGTALPTPDLAANPSFNMAGAGGEVFLLEGTTALTTTGNMVGVATVIDMAGFATASTFETAAGPTATTALSANRSAVGADTDNNSVDFALAAPSPTASGTAAPPIDPPVDPPVGLDRTIAQIQGTGATSPESGKIVSTTGVVTAVYKTGGYNGFYLQTAGTGGATDATPGASDAVFVYGLAAATKVAVGDSVAVTGSVSENYNTTQIVPADANAVVVLIDPLTPVTPLVTTIPVGDAAKEAHEGELLAPAGPFVVTNTYATNQYGEIGLAVGTTPLVTPTEVADAQDTDAIKAREADNAARAITLDDGASTNYLNTSNMGLDLPWLRKDNPVRVGAKVTFKSPVVLEFRNSTWKLQPSTQVTDAGTHVATFEDTRTPAPEGVGGDIRLATFNVLNYFPTTADEFVAMGGGRTCSTYKDRAGAPITANTCSPDGPRGAATTTSLKRQQDKIVTAINKLGASIVSLEEIENSVKFGKDRDFAVSKLVEALNTAAGSTVWAYAPSPSAADLPALSAQDVIRTAFIYKPADVSLVGASTVLVGDAAFTNARQPLAQAFKATGAEDSSAFAVIVNHFKSKGSGADDGTGQGNSNPDRIEQADALADFADAFKTERSISKVFLTGDFNAYSMEDPIQVLEERGYDLVDSTTDPEEETYSYSGQVGSLDHVLANDAAKPMITGSDVWQINSPESIAYEYSRYNYNSVDFYQPDEFRSSDHDPQIVGLNLGTPPVAEKVDLNLVTVNDFHGRINKDTVKWAGTVEQLVAEGSDDNTLLVGAGDLVGASEFASASDGDQPTIDMFNALGLDASAVGNHEFDQGWADLRDRIIGADGARNAQWDYLGANVYLKGTTTPAMEQYATYDVDGVTVGVIGAVTEETSTLVTPGGITALDFGDPVAAVDKVAKQLSDGDADNGEADVIVAAFHAGATQGTGSNYADQIAKDGEFANMASLDPAVDVIVNGHTHQTYAWDAPVPGSTTRTRPIIQTGEYGNSVGQIRLTIDRTTGTVDAYVARNVARTKETDADLAATYPRVAQVKTIVDAAIAKAAEIGNQPVGTIASDITRARSNGSFVDGKWVPANADANRALESALGGLVANALRDALPPEAGNVDLGIVNPGGLRTDLTYAGNTTNNSANTDGVVTYAEANTVLPFVNNVWTIKLSGADLTSVLEEQWQPAEGSFLNLGLSDNVRVTRDATKPRGERITSVIIDDEALDPAKTYTVSTFSFLGTGGDNFSSFRKGTAKDTGLVDRDLWISYLKSHRGLTPDFAPQQVDESGMPTRVTAGDNVAFELSKLNLTSSGSPENTSVSVQLRTSRGMRSMGTFPVTDGVANIAFTAPADVAGTATITATVMPSRTLVGLPATKDPDPVPVVKASSTTSATAAPSSVKVVTGTTTVSVAVAASGVTPTGTVVAWVDGTRTGSASLVAGKASLTAGPFTTAGTKQIELRYSGDANTEPSTTTTSVTVVKADSTTSATAAPSSVRVVSGTVTVDATVTGEGVTPTGTVEAWVNDTRTGSASLVAGKASLTAGPFTTAGTKQIELRYSGDANTEPSTTTTSVTVVKADSTTSATAAPSSVRVVKGTSSVTVTVAADGVEPTGTVEVVHGTTVLGRATLDSGSATVPVGPFSRVGTKWLTISYSGDASAASSSTTASVTVDKATATIAVSHSPSKVVLKRTRPVISVDLSAPGFTPTGSVQFRLGKRLLTTRQLSGGESSYRLPKLTGIKPKVITVVYSGDARTESQTVTHTIRVTR